MKDIDFFSSNSYIFLPTKNNPKVALCIDNSRLAKNAFKLYNPFSKKAQILKKFSFSLCVYGNFLSNFIAIKQKKSAIVTYLEKLLEKELYISLYYATARDKIVMQLQTQDAQIVGYVKYPLNVQGVQRISNEIKALEILSSKNILKPYMLKDSYENRHFVILHELDGVIDIVSNDAVKTLVQKFRREKSYRLENHPRILSLKESLYTLNMFNELSALEKICKNSLVKYALVYEHGDFAPWNIVKVGDEYIPFDFEYFVEDGLEYFDLIKYYYQIGNLLEAKSGDSLKNYVCSKIDMSEIEYLYDLYLIKEEVLNNLESE
jgi:hypothetical protein